MWESWNFTSNEFSLEVLKVLNLSLTQPDTWLLPPIHLVDRVQDTVLWYVSLLFLYARLKNGTYYAVAMSVRPSVRLSVCPSVRPSVRPRFPDFSSTCFEISIWNLVYAFSRWHDMSSLSCITIGSIWPSLQPKVGQTYFLQSWPHKSR